VSPVGRSTELETLRALLAGALAGSGAAAVVTGEAGIGKTTLVEAVARESAAGGCPVLVGRAAPDEGAPAFWPWHRLLAQAHRDGVAGSDPGRDGVAGLDPALLAPTAEPDPTPAARFLAIEATVLALRAAAEPAGLVLVLEDLQWADAASLDLLRHLCGEVSGYRILVLGTVREPADGLAGRAGNTPADLYGLSDRGRLALGAMGDVVIFDEDTIASRPTESRADLPAGAVRLYAEADGVERVLVAGQEVVAEGRFTGELPGRVLRSGKDTRTPSLS